MTFRTGCDRLGSSSEAERFRVRSRHQVRFPAREMANLLDDSLSACRLAEPGRTCSGREVTHQVRQALHIRRHDRIDSAHVRA